MKLGYYQTLLVERDTPQGFYLVDEGDEVLLPNNQIPDNLFIGDEVEVFVYADSEDRPIATLKKPHAIVGEFAALQVVAASRLGAFLDWGLDKDLLLPMKEQRFDLRSGDWVVVRVCLDELSGRLIATTKLGKYLHSTGELLKVGQQVEILVSEIFQDSVSVVIDSHTKGSIFVDEWHEDLPLGMRRKAYIKQIREADGRVAVSLRPQGYLAVLGEQERVLKALENSGGRLSVSDRSSPAEIQQLFGLSKGAFKKLIGRLFREGIIRIEEDYISLNR